MVFLSKYYENNELELPEIIKERITLVITKAIQEKLMGKVPDSDFVQEKVEVMLSALLQNVYYLDSEELFESVIKSLQNAIAEASDEVRAEFDAAKFEILEKFHEKVKYIEEALKRIYDKMILYFNNQNAKNEANDSYKELSDKMSKVLIDGIVDLPENIRAEFNKAAFDAQANFKDKLTYYEKALKNIYDKTAAYFAEDLQKIAELNKQIEAANSRLGNLVKELNGYFPTESIKAQYQQDYNTNIHNLNEFYAGKVKMIANIRALYEQDYKEKLIT